MGMISLFNGADRRNLDSFRSSRGRGCPFITRRGTEICTSSTAWSSLLLLRRSSTKVRPIFLRSCISLTSRLQRYRLHFVIRVRTLHRMESSEQRIAIYSIDRRNIIASHIPSNRYERLDKVRTVQSLRETRQSSRLIGDSPPRLRYTSRVASISVRRDPRLATAFPC